MKNPVTSLLVACLVTYLTGCVEPGGGTLTGRLWDSELAANHDGPNTPPDLMVAQSNKRHDFLVQYDEQRDKDGRIKHRAYWLYANEPRIKKGEKPSFVKPADVGDLQPMTVETNSVASFPATTYPESGAVLLTDQRTFTLSADGEDLGTFMLPSYRDAASRAKVVALTPVAAAGDAAWGIGTVAAVAGVIVWEGLASGDTVIP